MSDISLNALSMLPVPGIFETVAEPAIVEALVADFVARANAAGLAYDVPMVKGDPIIKALEAAATQIMLLRARGNAIARDNYLYFAAGSSIDHKAAFYDVARLPGESDERLKVRTILAIQGRSTAGPGPRYRGLALAASLRVADAVVFTVGKSPLIHVAVFAADNNGVADQALLALVRAAVEDPEKRCISDRFTVYSAVIRVEDVTIDLYLHPTTSEAVAQQVETALAAQWQAESGLGRDLTRDWIKAKAMLPGCYRADIIAPVADIIMQPFEAVRIGKVTVNVKGRDY